MLGNPKNRHYCHSCNELIVDSDITKHKNHDLKKSLTNYEMSHPTEFLKSLNNTKKEAQYFFSENTTRNIADILLNLGAKYILCIGVPRLYEYISHNFGNKMTCFLLDIDARFVSSMKNSSGIIDFNVHTKNWMFLDSMIVNMMRNLFL